MKSKSNLLSMFIGTLLTLLMTLPIISNAQTYDIFIWTTDQNMLAMGDVTVVLDGETIVTTGGPMGGEAVFTGKAPGVYPYTASKSGYVTVNGSVTVVNQNASDFAVMLPALYDIFIWTTDGMLPMGDVTVVLDGETIVTTGGPMGGEAVFTGKAPGVYPYTASKSGYVTVNGSVTVVNQNVSDFAVMLPALYDIFIWTTDGMLPMGDVTVILDGETIVTTGGPMGGEAVFTGKAPGVYPYTASKSGYVTVNGSVTVVNQNVSDFAVMLPALYDIFIWTTDGMLPMGDVTVILDGETIVTTGGPMGGEAVFTGKTPGVYPYTASKAGYVTVNGSVTVVDQNASDFAVMLPAIFDISFMCSAVGISGGLEGVDITMDGITVTSDPDGLALFEDYDPGTYSYIASSYGYVTQTGSVTVTDQNITVSIEMSIAYNDMLIWCYDESNSTPLPGVAITIDGTTIISDNSGLAFFNDYISGTYNFTATKDGFIDETGLITIINTTATVNVMLMPNAFDMYFWCSEQGNPMGLSGVDITIDGTIITSDFDGLAIFEGYAPGSYVYSASKDGYITHTGSVNVVDENISEFVVLGQLTYSVTFIVDNGMEFVEGVEIEMNGVISFTNENGESVFTEIAPGSYDYTISMDWYTIQSGTINVSDEEVIIPITLLLSGINDTFVNEVSIYPNPSTGNISIDNAENTTIQIIDQNGITIYKSNNNGSSNSVNLTNRPAGIYNVIFTSGNSIATRKLIITR